MMVSAHAADQRPGQRPDRGATAHHDDFLAKPVKLDLLMARLERLLRLDWVLDAPADGPRTAVRADAAALDALSAQLSIGHVRGFERALSGVDQSDAAAAAFVAEARLRLDRLDLSGLEALIAEARHGV
jgi:DNA-binding response OmpR family regulator